MYGVHQIHPLHRFIFHQYVEASGISARADARMLFSCIASDEAFKRNEAGFYPALGRTWHSLWPVLLTFYCVCIAIAIGMGEATRNYGAIRAWSERYTKTQWLRFLLRALLNKLLLEKVSFWHALLTPFTLADKSAELMLDVLTSNGTLYQGVSFQYFLDSDSKLAGVILKNPRRFARDLYAAAKTQAGDQPVDKDQYWRPIPSESLFIMGSSILNININYSHRLQVDLLEKFLAQALKAKHQIKITIESPVGSPPMNKLGSEQPPNEPE
jgi:hypothetical protein